MPIEKIEFYAFEAFVARVAGEKLCDLWLRDPYEISYDHNQTISIDLGQTPTKDFTKVEVDDFTSEGGLTSIGPKFPGSRRMEGGVWLTGAKAVQAKQRLGAGGYPPIAETADYRWKSILTRDSAAGAPSFRRYMGFHAELLARDPSGICQFRVWSTSGDIALPGDGKLIHVHLGDVTRCWKPDSAAFANLGSAGALFLELDFAIAGDLVAPKLPKGYGGARLFPRNYEEKMRRAVNQAQQSIAVRSVVQPTSFDCGKYSKKSVVNISHDPGDVELRAAQKKLKAVVELVQSMQQLEDTIVAAFQCLNGRHSMIDLVAHSTSVDQLLKFGEWTMAADDRLISFCERIKDRTTVAQRANTGLRLIGCATADSSAGKMAISTLEKRLGIAVFGTTTNVLLRNFSEDGYAGEFLQRANTAQSLRVAPLWALPAELEAPPREPDAYLPPPSGLGNATRIEAFLKNLFAKVVRTKISYEAPGLLLEPLAKVLMPLILPQGQPSGDGLKMDVLFDWRLLRIWPMKGGQATIYPIADPHAAEAQIRALDPLVEITHV